MSVDQARAYLKQFGRDEDIIFFDASTATVALAAAALQIEEDQIAKTLSFLVDGQPVLILAAGLARIQNGKFKQVFHTKAKMIPFAEVESYIGHPAGGVCPFGIKEGVRVYLDESLKRHTHVYPACGDAHTAIRMAIDELERISASAGWIDVTRS
ncbi:MAG: YbaK/EbsC family protein [bacterium]